MNEFQSLGRVLIIAGAAVVLIGIVLLFAGKIPFLGKLPGDIFIKGKNFTFYFPIVTSIILSIIISLLIYIFRK